MMLQCRVILDTSVLMLVYEGIDPLEGIDELLNTKCEYLVPDVVISELIKLSTQNLGPRSRAARLALSYIKGRVRVVSIKGRKYRTADEFIKDYVLRDREVVVATLDRELKEFLRRVGVKVITWWFNKRKFTEA